MSRFITIGLSSNPWMTLWIPNAFKVKSVVVFTNRGCAEFELFQCVNRRQKNVKVLCCIFPGINKTDIRRVMTTSFMRLMNSNIIQIRMGVTVNVMEILYDVTFLYAHFWDILLIGFYPRHNSRLKVNPFIAFIYISYLTSFNHML